MKAKMSNLIEILATCEDCGWECATANAQGLASQHAERHGHLVGVTISRYFLYATGLRYRMRPSDAKERFDAS